MYLPQIQHASECEWTHRHEVEYPARAREAALLRDGRRSEPRDGQPILSRWIARMRAIGARPVSPSVASATGLADGIV